MKPTAEQLEEGYRKFFESGKDALSAQAAPETINNDNRTVDVVWFTGIDVPRYDWYKDEVYIRRFDPKGVDLSLLNNGAPVADNHCLWSVENQLGRVDKAWVDGKNYKGTLRFSKRPEVDGLWMDIQDKIVTKFSMGVEILDSEDQKRKDDQPLVKLATQWRPYEISIAPIPADFGTTTLSAKGNRPSSQELEEQARRIRVGHNLRRFEIEVMRLR